MTEARKYFQRLHEGERGRFAALNKQYDRFAMVRLVVILGLLAGVVFAFGTGWLPGIVALGLFIVAAYLLVRRHESMKSAAEMARRRSVIAERELRALDHDFSFADDGCAYVTPLHPYEGDLDVLCDFSLFQFINKTTTALGGRKLADDLLYTPQENIRARTQVRSKELKSKPDWCVDFRAIGEELNDDLAGHERLREWLHRPALVPAGPDRVVIAVTPLLALASIVAIIFFVPWFMGALGFLPAVYLYRKYAERIAEEHAYTAHMGHILKQYADLLDHLGAWGAYTDRVSGSVPALRQLGYFIGQLDVRYNPFSILLELGGAWSLQWLRKLDAWRSAHQDDLPAWLEATGEADALVSWANLRFTRPDWAEPELTDEPVLQATGLGHPLLNPDGRVTNDIDMRTDGHIHLVTGSNMAGKSTWLRTVGINLVLSQAGGPVCATSLRHCPLQVWTSMRTQDDLSEATSSFYAELKRLQSIIEAVGNKETPVFFLLDEILKGTNSRDRHTGSRALIRQLIRDRGAGIIATHDLELAALENEAGSRVENYAMEVQTRGDDLVFDYKLHPGVCTSFNATALMARMGIDIPEEEIRLHHE